MGTHGSGSGKRELGGRLVGKRLHLVDQSVGRDRNEPRLDC